MASELPPGIAVGKTGVEAARLALQIRILCEKHRVNTPYDLPPDQFEEARIVSLREPSSRASAGK